MPNPQKPKEFPRWLTSVDPAKLGIGFIIAGFVALILGWNGAASINCVDCQLPYLISGLGVGLALVAIGIGLFMFEAFRRWQAHIEDRLDVLIETMAGASSNGSHPSAAPASQVAERPQVDVAPGMVVVGRSSFHRTDCRLVEGKQDLDYAPIEEAQKSLMPCRVCDPTAVDTPAPARRTRRR